MATNHNKKNGKGSVVTPAPNSAKGKSTTAKKAGVKTRKSTKTHAQLVAEARQSAKVNRHKMVYICATLDEALTLADKMKDSLTTAGIHEAGKKVNPSAVWAEKRREWCEKVGAPLVNIEDILHPNKEGESITARSENVLRSRIQTRSMKAHGRKDYYYAVRAWAFREDEQCQVYLVRL